MKDPKVTEKDKAETETPENDIGVAEPLTPGNKNPEIIQLTPEKLEALKKEWVEGARVAILEALKKENDEAKAKAKAEAEAEAKKYNTPDFLKKTDTAKKVTLETADDKTKTRVSSVLKSLRR